MTDEPSAPPPVPPTADPGSYLIMSILAYAWFLCLIPMLVEKNDRDLQWHSKNGLVLAVAITVFWIIEEIVFRGILVFSCLFSILGFLVSVIYLIVCIVGMIKCYRREKFFVPVLSPLVDKF